MVPVPVRYTFTQKFSVPVEEAFMWSIDYDPGDFALMGQAGTRKINKLTEDTFILEDAKKTPEGVLERTRLIRINPDDHSFTNTHITGPTLHSQFWYEFFPEGKRASRLVFTGLLLYPSDRKLNKKEVAQIAAKEVKTDSLIWKNLAKAMEADLKKVGKKSR
jgi:hypothetical protein